MATSRNQLHGSTLTQAPLGNSKPQREMRDLIIQVAKHDTLVLIQGESGSGKEVVARSIHNESIRRDRNFIPINCGAIPADLLESELFGHEKGAFTGAISARKGRFELAEGGTLFLDEIGDMSLPMQVKLLRVLQERCFERVGGSETIHCDVRIVAATHRDLASMIIDGSFRHDLFFRLNIFPIEVPALRAHVADLPQLIQHFLSRFEKKGMSIPRFTKAALETMALYSWPGNVRELENLLERLCITHASKIVSSTDLPLQFVEFLSNEQVNRADDAQEEILKPVDFPVAHKAAASSPVPFKRNLSASEQGIVFPETGFDLKVHMQETEKTYICEALKRAGGTITQAAKILGLQRTTLAEKMKKMELTPG